MFVINPATSFSKTLWFPCTLGSTHSAVGTHPAWKSTGVIASYASCEIWVPGDFVGIEEFWMEQFPGQSATVDWDITTNFCANNQLYNQHTDSLTLTPTVVNNTRKDQDIGSAFSGLAARDIGGFKIEEAAGAHVIYLVGIKLKYRN